jgi:hypothetical protein
LIVVQVVECWDTLKGGVDGDEDGDTGRESNFRDQLRSAQGQHVLKGPAQQINICAFIQHLFILQRIYCHFTFK